MTPIPRLVVHDVEQHGVATYARDVVRAVVTAGAADPSVSRGDVPALPPGTSLHLHFTDRLWQFTDRLGAGSPEEAARAVLRLTAQHPFTATFHDVPQPSDGARNLPRRRDCYRAVAASAVGIVCNSAHEAALLREHDVRAASVGVIPLPVDVAGGCEPVETDGSIGVLGYFYPGKGHHEALDAAVRAGVGAISILGRASDGHAADLEAFVRGAAARGVAVDVSGYLDDAELLRRCRRVGVPVVAHRHVSASGSLGSWIAAGRRPVATANRYIDEMAALRPGTIAVADAAELAAAVSAALADPPSTWLSSPTVPHGRREAGAAYLDWWAGLPW